MYILLPPWQGSRGKRWSEWSCPVPSHQLGWCWSSETKRIGASWVPPAGRSAVCHLSWWCSQAAPCTSTQADGERDGGGRERERERKGENPQFPTKMGGGGYLQLSYVGSCLILARFPSSLLFLLWVHLLPEVLIVVDGLLCPLQSAVLPKLLPRRLGVAEVSPLDEVLGAFTTRSGEERNW